MPYLILLRGLPGSGKTTTAELLCRQQDHLIHYEADQFMIDDNGDYKFDPQKLHYCHKKCYELTKKAIELGFNVVVANTFTRIWEMKPYIELANSTAAILSVITCEGNYPSKHNVPSETIERMRNRWETFSLDTINARGLSNAKVHEQSNFLHV